MVKVIVVTLLALLMCSTGTAVAGEAFRDDGNLEQQTTTAPAAGKAEEAEREEIQETVNREFLGIEFGLGLGMAIDISEGDRVEEASVVAGVVRVNKTGNAQPRILLETHYFWQLAFEERTRQIGSQAIRIREADIGIGPFVAVQGSDEQVLESFALGVMIGFKRSESSSLNLGFGLVLDPDVKTLGDGIVENQPLPAGETEVRFKQESRWGIVALASFSF